MPHIHEQFDIHGRLLDDELRGRLQTLLAALAEPATAAGRTAQLAVTAS